MTSEREGTAPNQSAAASRSVCRPRKTASSDGRIPFPAPPAPASGPSRRMTTVALSKTRPNSRPNPCCRRLCSVGFSQSNPLRPFRTGPPQLQSRWSYDSNRPAPDLHFQRIIHRPIPDCGRSIFHDRFRLYVLAATEEREQERSLSLCRPHGRPCVGASAPSALIFNAGKRVVEVVLVLWIS